MTTAITPSEVVQTPVDSWRRAHGLIMGWVDTDLPGYRTVSIGGTTYTVAAGYHRWDDYIDELDTAITASGWSASWDDGTGRVTLSGSSSTVAFADRLGWLIGVAREPTLTLTSQTSVQSVFVAPGCIPCLGVTWDEVDIERDREVLYDRSRRQQGYVFGGSRVWRIRATLTRYALEALLSGWVLRGKVTIRQGPTPTAISGSVEDGAITGHVLGLTDVSWIDAESLQGLASVSMLVTTTTT